MGRDANDEDLEPVYSPNEPKWIVSGGGNMRRLMNAMSIVALLLIIWYMLISISGSRSRGNDGMIVYRRPHPLARRPGVYRYEYDPALLPVDYAPVYVRRGNRIIEIGGFANDYDKKMQTKYRTRK